MDSGRPAWALPAGRRLKVVEKPQIDSSTNSAPFFGSSPPRVCRLRKATCSGRLSAASTESFDSRRDMCSGQRAGMDATSAGRGLGANRALSRRALRRYKNAKVMQLASPHKQTTKHSWRSLAPIAI
eukprot:scaffold116068_cov69-Phaeocystis_antarctica.AAC.2